MFEQVTRLVALCERTAPCASETFLDEADEAVLAELHRRQVVSRQGQGKRGSGPGHNVSSAISVHSAAGLVWGDLPDQPRHTDSPWFNELPSGVKTTLQYSISVSPDAAVRDIGQSLNRVRYSKIIPDPMASNSSKHKLFCQMPQQLGWIALPGRTPRLMIGRESMMAQGFPVGLPGLKGLLSATTEATMASLGGNAMASHVVLALLQATFASIPWNHTTSSLSCHHFTMNVQQAQVEQAMSLLQLITKPEGATESEDSDDETPNYKVRRTMIMPRS